MSDDQDKEARHTERMLRIKEKLGAISRARESSAAGPHPSLMDNMAFTLMAPTSIPEAILLLDALVAYSKHPELHRGDAKVRVALDEVLPGMLMRFAAAGICFSHEAGDEPGPFSTSTTSHQSAPVMHRRPLPRLSVLEGGTITGASASTGVGVSSKYEDE